MSTGVSKSSRRSGVKINVPVTQLPGIQRTQACEGDQEEGCDSGPGSGGGTGRACANASYSV
jgi:hypothetical protein